MKNYGRGILNVYEESPIKLITSFYPDYPWLPWKFNTAKNFWNNRENQINYMNWLYNELKMTSMEDWYHISKEVNLLFFKLRFSIYKIKDYKT